MPMPVVGTTYYIEAKKKIQSIILHVNLKLAFLRSQGEKARRLQPSIANHGDKI